MSDPTHETAPFVLYNIVKIATHSFCTREGRVLKACTGEGRVTNITVLERVWFFKEFMSKRVFFQLFASFSHMLSILDFRNYVNFRVR